MPRPPKADHPSQARALGWVWRIDEAVAALALVVIVLSVVWGVIARYIAPQPSTWSNELAAIAFAWMVFVGAAAAARKRLHVGVDLLTARLSSRMAGFIGFTVSIFVAVAFAYAAMLSLEIGLEARTRPTPVLRLPYTIVYLAASVGLTAMAVTSAAHGVRSLREGAR